jgi:dTDP-4-dehydrorhamnose reductase
MEFKIPYRQWLISPDQMQGMKKINTTKKITGQVKPEIWGGIECTINRVKNNFNDQLHSSKHYYREDDIDAIAGLGITTLRYPVLWEKHQPGQNDTINWSWIEKQMDKIRLFNITPIAGLLHHGSGPAFTHLLDPLFPEKFAGYARQVATKFPWLKYYTPVNEPLTTARFSGLYGLWYPHRTNAKSFIIMLLNQLKATVLAMKEIRKINPGAQLIQTEDLALVQSTPKLKYQADFENQRRWLTYDILCGKVDESHPLWNYLTSLGIPKKKLLFFVENQCPPDIIGCNYYLTSERYLDEDTGKYPAHTYGGNGKHNYADVESVRVNKLKGLEYLLKEVWKRYKIPVAITEVHLHCTREEQMRWLMQAWHTCWEKDRYYDEKLFSFHTGYVRR